MTRFGDWLHTTRELQLKFGVDPTTLEGEELADYLTWNLLALHTEIGELAQELPWRPWKPGRGELDPEQQILAEEELADILHFVGNLALALRLDDAELSAIYADKQEKNRQRLKDGRSIQTAS